MFRIGHLQLRTAKDLIMMRIHDDVGVARRAREYAAPVGEILEGVVDHFHDVAVLADVAVAVVVELWRQVYVSKRGTEN